MKGGAALPGRSRHFNCQNNYRARLKKKLPPPACHFFEATIGWLELGNPREALAELSQIPNEFATEPQVLEVKWQILARIQAWDQCLPVAEKFCAVAPALPQSWLHRAVSLYRLNRTQEAWDLLLPLAKKFPRSWIISYDLACYACQLGNIAVGRKWLKKAFKLGDPAEIKPLALADPDLKSLWPEIANSSLDPKDSEEPSKK